MTAAAKSAPPPAAVVKKPNRRSGSGRPAENRADPISIYIVRRGAWMCKCGSENKVSVRICPGKKGPPRTPCGRPSPYVRICLNLPIQIASDLIAMADRDGVTVTALSSLKLAAATRDNDKDEED